uniref:Phospholipid/glycerol acyltransferase domain-containing protein n=1 Tax=Trichobilharzia regenti TaxID=157069 RepID=A0AA85J6V3_TRIRE|nr:unnamed protein product [Trichobilharzia regenti]
MKNLLRYYFGLTVGFLAPTGFLMWLFVRLLTLHSQQAYRYFNELILSSFMRTFLLTFGYMSVRKIYVYGDVDFVKNKNERVLFISNHLSTVDWFICSMLVAHQGGLGRTRFVLHKNLKYIPIFGFYLSQDSCLFVDRQNFDVKTAVNILSNMKKLQSNTWMVIYPEGTRYNPLKYDVIKQSQEFAVQKAGIKPFKHVLVPRRRGFQLILNHLHDCLDALYDVTTVFADEDGYPYDHYIPAPGLTDWLKKPRSLHIYLKRIPIRDIPRDSESIRRWLYERYRIKDDFIDNVQTRFYGISKLSESQMNNNHVNHHEDKLKLIFRNENNTLNDHGVNLNRRMRNLTADFQIIQKNFLECFTSEMSRDYLEIPKFRLIDLLPSALLWYGITIYWIFGFGWYGVITYFGIGLFGSIGGQLYMHFAI